jgi:pyruvate dehydrogenase E1 component
MGAIMPEVLAAAAELDAAGMGADVVCLTSADLVFRALQARQGLADGDDAILDDLLPADRAAPMVTVLDGHPHTLSFLGTVQQVPVASLGVSAFGQSGDVDDLYRHVGIDTETIVGAALDLLG